MLDNRTTASYLTVAAVTVAAGLAVYAVYFDHKRRNDAEFRKKLKKEKKRIQKSVAQTKETELADSTSNITPAALKDAIQQVKNEPTPQSPEEKETYFMTQVGLGEQLTAQGPQFYLPAAQAFFRALRVYPSPVELIVIYQKTIIEPVFKLVMDMTNLDVKDRIEGYYEHFPPEWTNVTVKTREPIPGQGVRSVLVVEKDFADGEVIYKEFPIVTALDADLQAKGTHCGHCLRVIDPEMASKFQDDPISTSFPSSYCSKECMIAAKNQYQTLLFSSDSPLPSEIPSAPVPPALQEDRRKAQAKLAEYIQKEGKNSPLLVARFIARQVAVETQKMVAATTGLTKPAPAKNDFTDSDAARSDDGYSLADHVERLRYLEVNLDMEENKLLSTVLRTALPGLEEFITEERHSILSGKMAYNAFGVILGYGRNDKPQPTQRPEDVEKTRTSFGTERQVGSALYTVSSYLPHSCLPTAKPLFHSGNAEISIIANGNLKKGDELTISFVNNTQDPFEPAADCRRRRRKELARGWRFACGCALCVSQAETAEEKGGQGDEGHRDGSRVEDSMKRHQQADLRGEDSMERHQQAGPTIIGQDGTE